VLAFAGVYLRASGSFNARAAGVRGNMAGIRPSPFSAFVMLRWDRLINPDVVPRFFWARLWILWPESLRQLKSLRSCEFCHSTLFVRNPHYLLVGQGVGVRSIRRGSPIMFQDFEVITSIL